MLFKRKKPAPVVEYIVLPPETLEAIIPRRTNLSFMTWYKAIYLVNEQPDIKTHNLALALGVGWGTARNMKGKIEAGLKTKD